MKPEVPSCFCRVLRSVACSEESVLKSKGACSRKILITSQLSKRHRQVTVNPLYKGPRKDIRKSTFSEISLPYWASFSVDTGYPNPHFCLFCFVGALYIHSLQVSWTRRRGSHPRIVAVSRPGSGGGWDTAPTQQ